jgi:hypothetical protein
VTNREASEFLLGLACDGDAGAEETPQAARNLIDALGARLGGQPMSREEHLRELDFLIAASDPAERHAPQWITDVLHRLAAGELCGLEWRELGLPWLLNEIAKVAADLGGWAVSTWTAPEHEDAPPVVAEALMTAAYAAAQAYACDRECLRGVGRRRRGMAGR